MKVRTVNKIEWDLLGSADIANALFQELDNLEKRE